MRFEIVRRFLNGKDGWCARAKPPRHLREAVLRRDDGGKVPVRTDDGTAWLAMKGPRTEFTRTENEFEIPIGAKEDLLRRPIPTSSSGSFAVSSPAATQFGFAESFRGSSKGILQAKIQLRREDERVLLPDWMGREITEDKRLIDTTSCSPCWPRLM